MKVPVQQVLYRVLGSAAPPGAALSGARDGRVDAQSPADAQRPLIVDGHLMAVRQAVPDAAVPLVRALGVDLLHQTGDPPVFLRPRT